MVETVGMVRNAGRWQCRTQAVIYGRQNAGGTEPSHGRQVQAQECTQVGTQVGTQKCTATQEWQKRRWQNRQAGRNGGQQKRREPRPAGRWQQKTMVAEVERRCTQNRTQTQTQVAGVFQVNRGPETAGRQAETETVQVHPETSRHPGSAVQVAGKSCRQ